jgi:hypothetical protein
MMIDQIDDDWWIGASGDLDPSAGCNGIFPLVTGVLNVLGRDMATWSGLMTWA